PDLRVVVILREPAARVLSSFSYPQNNLGRIPARVGFADYLAAVQAGAPLTGMVQHPARAYVLARDPEYSRYATWLAP
ncbi:sulfotransferase, partial [Sagittula sp. M10.9X]|nr:sulfotransferase [Sagittula salina]